MKPNYTPQIENILHGSSITAEASAVGVHAEVLRRLLLKHPDYATAKENGKLHAKGIPPKLNELAHGAWRAAIDEVVIDRKSAKSVADQNKFPLASFMKAIRYAYPDIDMRYRNDSPAEAAHKRLQNKRKALARAEKAFTSLTSTNLG